MAGRFLQVVIQHGWGDEPVFVFVARVSYLFACPVRVLRNSQGDDPAVWLEDLAAEAELAATGTDCGPDGLLTYVWDAKVRSVNPGYCFKVAGWTRLGRSADGRKTLLHKPFAMAGMSA